MNSEIIIKAKIWENEVFSLIDYSDTESKVKKLKVNSSGVLCRNQKEISFNQGENQPQSPNELLRIQKNTQIGKYVINCGKFPKDLNKLVDENAAFLVYRGFYIQNFNNNGNYIYHRLYQGDIFKIGRVYFKVLDIYLNYDSFQLQSSIDNSSSGSMIKSSSFGTIVNGQQVIRGSFSPNFMRNTFNKFYNNQNNLLNFKISNLQRKRPSDSFINKNETFLPKINSTTQLMSNLKDTQNISINESNEIDKKPKKLILKKKNKIIQNKPICRICYREDSDEKDPLISPCICKGSMKYIHYKCLKNWLNSKIENDIVKDSYDNQVHSITYNRKDISCELCNEQLPDYIKHNNRYYNICFYKPKFEEFMVLESVTTSDKEKKKYIHLISFDHKNSIIIGSSKECELTINDESVNPYHCFIRKKNGELFLEDNLSKYGTLVLIQNDNIIMNDLVPLKLQINQTFIKLRIKLPLNFKCCRPSPYQNTLESKKYDYQIQNRKYFDILSYFTIKEDDSNPSDDESNKEGQSEESINSNNISKLIIDEDEDNDIINEKDNQFKSKINNILSKGNDKIENNIINFEINSFYINPKIRFKNINIKKDKYCKYDLPELDKINMDIFKDNTSLNFNKSSQILFNCQHKKKKINLLKINNNNSNLEQ